MGSVKKTNRYEMDMSSGPLLRKIITFAVPLILASNLQLMFNAVDVIVVGRFSGSLSLAAVGSTTALINLMINFLTGISLGVGVLAGQYFASGKEKAMSELVHTAVGFALTAGIGLGCLGIFFARWALTTMGTPSEVLPLSLLYIRVYFLGLPFFMLFTYGAAVLRAVGDTKRPLFFLTLAGILNAVLNMILVIGFDLDVLGVAVATVFSQFVSCILVIRCLIKTEGSYHLNPGKLTLRMDYLKKIFKIGLPAGLQSMVMDFSNILLQSSVNTLGQTAMAGYTASNSVFGFLFVTSNAFTQTCMSFMSQNFGAGKWNRMPKVLRDCMGLGLGTIFVMGSAIYLFREPIFSIYTHNPEAIQAGCDVFRFTTVTYFILTIADILPGAMRGFGYSTVPMILYCLGIVGVRILWIFGVFPIYHELDLLFISYPLSWIAAATMEITYFTFIWRRMKRKREQEEGLPAA